MIRLQFIIAILLFINTCIAQDYENLNDNDRSKWMLASSSPSLLVSSKCHETNYISDNISSVRVIKVSNKVYISWDICDDPYDSEIFVLKTTDMKHYTMVGSKRVESSNIGVPLLYSMTDTSSIETVDTYYKFFKIIRDGTIKHIVTVLLPQKN